MKISKIHKCILLISLWLLPLVMTAQTPYDSFAPEATRPMIVTPAERWMQKVLSDSMAYTIAVDTQSRTLYLINEQTDSLEAMIQVDQNIVMWLSVDPLADKYIDASPYVYCNGNPLLYIDEHGDSISILTTNSFFNIGHMAIAVQDENGKWNLYSKNGEGKSGSFSSSSGSIDPNDVGRIIESPEVFLRDAKDNTVNHDGNGELYYTEMFTIPTTAAQDKTIATEMEKQLQQVPYNLFFNNCTQAVQRALGKAGVSFGTSTMYPKKSMQSIKSANTQK